MRDDHRYFLITHGTDRMAQNAQALQERLEGLGAEDKRVIFTGAMMPLSMQEAHPGLGDAEVNVEFALQHIQHAKPGVYLAARNAATMRMELIPPQGMIKDMERSKDLQFTVIGR